MNNYITRLAIVILVLLPVCLIVGHALAETYGVWVSVPVGGFTGYGLGGFLADWALRR